MPVSRANDVTISNIKLSCKIDLLDETTISLNKEADTRSHGNFTVVKKRYVYIIFKKRKNKQSYHVNITKVPSSAEIMSSIDQLSRIITNNFIVKSYNIENMTCSFDAGFNIPVIKVFDQLEKKSFVKKARFNPERFPGIFVTFEFNTILLFSSGKMVIIGANDMQSVEDSLDKILHFLKPYKALQI